MDTEKDIINSMKLQTLLDITSDGPFKNNNIYNIIGSIDLDKYKTFGDVENNPEIPCYNKDTIRRFIYESRGTPYPESSCNISGGNKIVRRGKRGKSSRRGKRGKSSRRCKRGNSSRRVVRKL